MTIEQTYISDWRHVLVPNLLPTSYRLSGNHASPRVQQRSVVTIFRLASEEETTKLDPAGWDDEGGHMSCTAGRIVHTPTADVPYKVVMSHDGGDNSEKSFATIQECEAYIRRNTPEPDARSTLFDRDAGDA